MVRVLSVIAVGVVAILVGCSLPAAEESQHESYSHGAVQLGVRELRYNLFGGGQVATHNDPPMANIEFARGVMTLNNRRALINNEDMVRLPEQAKIIRVYYSDGQLRISADGSRIYSSMLRSSRGRIE
jgi:hypothetical protein